ncbi:Hypothetical predicted protein, partial [Marmota monax]
MWTCIGGHDWRQVPTVQASVKRRRPSKRSWLPEQTLADQAGIRRQASTSVGVASGGIPGLARVH